MTDFHVPAEDSDYDGLIDLVRRDLSHDRRYGGAVDRLSYDLDGDGHFDLVKEDGNAGNPFRC
jgi:hypothetical protein